jgi:SAM-dependent methyltransferase
MEPDYGETTMAVAVTDIQPHYGHQLHVLEVLASATRYNDWIASLALPHLGEHPIEIGSGLGDQADRWLRAGVPRVTVSDLELRARDALESRFADDDRIDVRQIDIEVREGGSYSAVVAVNVLEHIRDDIAALRNVRELLRPHGRVVIFVPAIPFAMSRFDGQIGHFRRYTKPMLFDRLAEADLEPIDVRYVNAPGLLAWLVMMKALRGQPSDGRLLQAWDRLVVPLTRALESRFSVPFGQSVLAVATPR